MARPDLHTPDHDFWSMDGHCCETVDDGTTTGAVCGFKRAPGDGSEAALLLEALSYVDFLRATQRYQSQAEVVVDAWMGPQTARALGLLPPLTRRERVAAWCRRHAMATGYMVTALLAVVVFLALAAWGVQPWGLFWYVTNALTISLVAGTLLSLLFKERNHEDDEEHYHD